MRVVLVRIVRSTKTKDYEVEDSNLFSIKVLIDHAYRTHLTPLTHLTHLRPPSSALRLLIGIRLQPLVIRPSSVIARVHRCAHTLSVLVFVRQLYSLCDVVP